MRLKSQQPSTNQRLKTHVVAIPVVLVICCLLTHEATGYVTRTGRAVAKAEPENKAADANATDDDDDAYHRPHFTDGRSVMVQLFEWKFLDIAEECRTFLGPQGYAGVQLSPVLEHTVIKTGNLNHPWWQRYETVSYRFASRSGDESEFWSMSRICNDHGVRIYIDAVLNHMAAPLNALLHRNTTAKADDFIVNTLLATDVNITSNLVYPNVPYSAKDFHRPCAILNTPNAYEIRNCQLNGHPDLDHYHASVKEPIVKMMNRFIDMGVAGFRIDTAKNMWPIDLKYISKELKDLSKDFNFKDKARPFIYHDVFDIGLDVVSKTEYSTYGVVSEYLYAVELSTILNGKAPLSSLINWGPAMGFLPHQDSLVFIDSHDTQRGLPRDLGKNHVVTHKHRNKYIMANAMMLSHPYGRIKRIMSSYYFDKKDINRGPPSEEGDDDAIQSPQFDDQQQCIASSGWVCEHRWPPLVQLVAMANYFSIPGQEEESIIHFQTNGPNQIAFCRGHKAFVAMNNDPEKDFVKEVFTCLEEGMYCDIISGGLKKGGMECYGRSLEVNAEGYARLNLPVADDNMEESEGIQFTAVDDAEAEEGGGNVVESFGVLAVYVGSKIGMESVVVQIMTGKEEDNGKGVEPAEDHPNDGNDDKDEGENDKPANDNNEPVEDKSDEDAAEHVTALTENEEGKAPEEGTPNDGNEEEVEPVVPAKDIPIVDVPVEETSNEELETPVEDNLTEEAAEVPAAEEIPNEEAEIPDDKIPGEVAEGPVEETQKGEGNVEAEVPEEEIPNEETVEVAETPVEEIPNEESGEVAAAPEDETLAEKAGEDIEEAVDGTGDADGETPNEEAEAPGEDIPNENAADDADTPVEEPPNEEAGDGTEVPDKDTAEGNGNAESEILNEGAAEGPKIPVVETPNDESAEDAETPVDETPKDEAGEEPENPEEDTPSEDTGEGDENPVEEPTNNEAAEAPVEETLNEDAGEATTEEEIPNDNGDENEGSPIEETPTEEDGDGAKIADVSEDNPVEETGESATAPEEETPTEEEGEGVEVPNEEAVTNTQIPVEEILGKEADGGDGTPEEDAPKEDFGNEKENNNSEAENKPVDHQTVNDDIKPKQTEKPAVEKIDKRQTNDEDNNNSDHQLEGPLSGKDLTQVKAIADDVANKIQETITNSTIEIVNHINASQTTGAGKTEKIAEAGFFHPKQKPSGNG